MEKCKLWVVFAMITYSHGLLTEGSSHHSKVVLLYFYVFPHSYIIPIYINACIYNNCVELLENSKVGIDKVKMDQVKTK